MNLLNFLIKVFNKIKRKTGGEIRMVKKVKETSTYSIFDDKGNLVKAGFKSLDDAYEYAVNVLLKEEVQTVKIKGEITITAKR